LRFDPPGRFLAPAFAALLALFFGEFLAGLAADVLTVDRRLLPPKMVSQLSEYCLVAPMRVTLMVNEAP
jgi:hypothetical protein